MHKYFIIALGGGLGSVARYLVGTVVADRLGTKVPYGTFVINMSACIVIGFSIAFLGKRTDLSPDWRYLIPIGFVGAYSTFSTFEWEAFTNLQNGAFFTASLYVVSSIVLGLVAVWLGALVARVMP